MVKAPSLCKHPPGEFSCLFLGDSWFNPAQVHFFLIHRWSHMESYGPREAYGVVWGKFNKLKCNMDHGDILHIENGFLYWTWEIKPH